MGTIRETISQCLMHLELDLTGTGSPLVTRSAVCHSETTTCWVNNYDFIVIHRIMNTCVEKALDEQSFDKSGALNFEHGPYLDMVWFGWLVS